MDADAKRQRYMDFLTAIQSISPSFMQVAGDLILRASGLPDAATLAARLKPTMPKPPSITCEFVAYEFLRLLGNVRYRDAVVGGPARKGDRIPVSRTQEFHFPTPNGWSKDTKKLAVMDMVLIDNEIVERISVASSNVIDPDDFSDNLIRPAVLRIREKMERALNSNSATVVMATPEYPEGDFATFVAADAGAGKVVGVMKSYDAVHDCNVLELRVLFGFLGSVIKIADIFSATEMPVNPEIAALEAEKVRLLGVLRKLTGGKASSSLPNDATDWQRIMNEAIADMANLSPKAPWVSSQSAASTAYNAAYNQAYQVWVDDPLNKP